MRTIAVLAAVLFSSFANASKIDAATELATYRQYVSTVGYMSLIGEQTNNLLRAGGTCALSTSVAFASFASDTLPLANPIAEWLANSANKNYKSYEVLWSWETLGNAVAPTAGGAVVASYEFFDFLVKFAAGEEMNWDLLKQVYASSFAVTEKVFSEQSRCVINLAKIAVVRMQWRKGAGVAPYTPMQQLR